MESRNQFTFYASFYESAQRIRSKSARADLYDSICRYALTGEAPDLDKLSESAAVAFVNAKPNLTASRKKAKAGAQGGRQSQANRKQTASRPDSALSPPPREIENEIEIEKEIEIENEYECNGDGQGAKIKICFDQIWGVYPPSKRGDHGNACQAFSRSIQSLQEAETAYRNLTLWKKSAQWTKEGGQFVPYLANWLSRGLWQFAPEPEPSCQPSCTLGEAELEAIRAVLAQ